MEFRAGGEHIFAAIKKESKKYKRKNNRPNKMEHPIHLWDAYSLIMNKYLNSFYLLLQIHR